MAAKAASWIWHPDWNDSPRDISAGGFVHFRKSITLAKLPTFPIRVQITADTRYKFYINKHLVSNGPVKGDRHLWFYDEVDVQPHLNVGRNEFAVRVLRFYHATNLATSFPRLPYVGLWIRNAENDGEVSLIIQSDDSWETAIDTSTHLPTNHAEDEFLHTYESVDKRKDSNLTWVPASKLSLPSSHGLSAPWNLSPRMTPMPEAKSSSFLALHNKSSLVDSSAWQKALLQAKMSGDDSCLRLPAGTSHHLELECAFHTTASLIFRFARPVLGGSSLRITYSECYEDEPEQVPYLRRKGNRRDTTKKLIGPSDEYIFGGTQIQRHLNYHDNEENEEHFSPFHFRTFRFIAIDIDVDPLADLVLLGIDVLEMHYPLKVLSSFQVSLHTEHLASEYMYKNDYGVLYDTSIRTLKNCMHDTYEDCPFYEQLQYAMDARSSALFTYTVSGDDRLARQAIIQLHNSFEPSIGLTASRAPSHQVQFIPHFSLFWVCMVADHFAYFREVGFVQMFVSVCDAVLGTFAARIDPVLGLVRGLDRAAAARQWDFVDWTEEWRPLGIPPAAERTGYQTYTNSLYAYTLKLSAEVQRAVGRSSIAEEYCARAEAVVTGIRKHCFNGRFFTDGLYQPEVSHSHNDLSQTNQIWAILCGASSGTEAQQILHQCLIRKSSSGSQHFAPASTAMSFYAFRALSLVRSTLYDDHFHQSWYPWREQLAMGMTTWLEDTVSQRSDCHAWGSAPLYELLAEVVGIRPIGDGLESEREAWTFEPRPSLFLKLNAKVPVITTGGVLVARVEWESVGDNVRILFLLEGEISSGMRIHVLLPEGQKHVTTVTIGRQLEFLVSKTTLIYEPR